MHKISHKYLIIAVPNVKGNPSHPTTAVIIEDMISRIHGQLKGLCLLCEIALEMFNILQATNNSYPDNQGPPPDLYSSDISH